MRPGLRAQLFKAGTALLVGPEKKQMRELSNEEIANRGFPKKDQFKQIAAMDKKK